MHRRFDPSDSNDIHTFVSDNMMKDDNDDDGDDADENASEASENRLSMKLFIVAYNIL